MEIILENYLIIILIGLFIVFALIGYLIETIRKTNSNNEEAQTTLIKPVELTEIVEKNGLKEIIETNETKEIDTKDELLKNYEENISE